MNEKSIPIVIILIFGLITTISIVQASEEVKVPFSAIKSICYMKVDISKSEFSLSEVGRQCVSEDWLYKNAPKQEATTKAYFETESYGNTEAVNIFWNTDLTPRDQNAFVVEIYDKSY